MSRIAIPAIESAIGATADIYAQVREIAGGRVPNTFTNTFNHINDTDVDFPLVE
ncbi:hypothetical protein [Noviherbaspirillum sp.]|uniref:hypothetical protein n=1 Tax=Noviherbaspirillum sp. TaxID=1926288 RepID=UPI002B4A6BCD|nr:hypothetical protein [Noviherbaspirillum sp.]HJV79370.1 hypothetical protein [Noviherbaspirillum sp.]